MSRIPGWANVSSLVLRFVLFAGVALCAQLAGPAWARVIHVKADATGANNGQSWANAYTDLPTAGLNATFDDEIWVARGTYKPTTGDSRTASFALQSGVSLYGGFAGTETARGQRNWEANPTILSGDIGIAGDAADNSYHVVRGNAMVTYPSLLDGFTITGGNANGSGGDYSQGGGMYNYYSSSTVTNCTFSGNTAYWQGGGMYNYHSSSTVTNCTFSGNTKGTYQDGGGGGMYNFYSSSTVTNCTFSGNTVNWGPGGGMYNDDSSPIVTNCTFSGNTAYGRGGGMYNTSSSPIVTNCTFSGNTSDGTQGGGMYNNTSSPAVTNCTFSGNTAGPGSQGSGGGMYNYGGSPTMTNCIFWGNTAPSGAEVYKTTGTPTFSHCDIKGCVGSGASWDSALGVDGGGNIGGDPRFVAPASPVGADGLWRTRDDGLRLRSDSPCIGAADPAAAPGTDILGLPRKTAPDIGAYEFPSSGYGTLTYNAGAGGSISGATPQIVDYGTNGTAVEALPDTGYHFLQWNDSSAMNPRTDTNVTADVTVTATFAINTYTLTYNAGTGGSISGTTPQTVDYGTSGAAVEAVPSVGYRFKQWSDGVLTASRTDTNVTADINVTAVFAPLAAAKDWALYE